MCSYLVHMPKTDVPLSVEDALKLKMSKRNEFDFGIEASTAYAQPPALPIELVEGVLRFGHKMILAGPPDSGKTSLLLGLALAVSQGKQWLDLNTQQADVLFINLELHANSFVNRLHKAAKALELNPCDKHFHFINHRGGNLDPQMFTTELRKKLVESKLNGVDFKLVVIDPIYKLIGMGGADETSNLRASQLITGLGDIAEIGDVTFAFAVEVANDHPRFQVTNEIENGIGQLARDADSVLTLWPLDRHDTAYRLKGQMREFESFTPMSLTFAFPIFTPAPLLDRVPIRGTDAWTPMQEENETPEVDIWKIWDSLENHDSVTLDQLAKRLSLTQFETKQKIAQAGPHPKRPNLKLRFAAGGKIKAEEG